MPGTKTQVATHHVRSVRTIRVRTARSSRAPTRAPERQLAETDGQNPAAGAPYEQAHSAIEGGSTRERAGGALAGSGAEGYGVGAGRRRLEEGALILMDSLLVSGDVAGNGPRASGRVR